MAEATLAFHRESAQKILLVHLQEGKVVQEEGATWLMLPSLGKAARVNVVATVLIKETMGNITNILVDDGTGQAVLRFFELLPAIEQVGVGKVILVVGKPRKYNQEVYLSPEIIKIVHSSWLQVRKKELQQEITKSSLEKAPSMQLPEMAPTGGISGILVEPVVRDEALPKIKLMGLIREMDSGRGVLIEELLEKSSLPETEHLLEKLLKSGELFQNTPGKVKVL